jgi:hypothetical protein
MQLGAQLAVLLWGIPMALAQPPVTIATAGDCPSRDQLDVEISQWSLPSTPSQSAPWRASVDRPILGKARLRLYAPDGALALQRDIRSEDCVALAKAFAIILETHFLDLGLVLPRKIEPAPEEPPPAQSTPAAKPEPAPPAKPKPAEPRPTQQHTAASSRLRIALGIGGQWALPDPGLTAAARGLFGISWHDEWTLQLGLSAALPQSQRGVSNNDQIDSQAFAATLGLAHRVRVNPDVWLEPHLGAGARISHLVAHEIVGEDEISTRVLAELGLASGLQLGPNWSPRLDVVGQILLDRDRYIIVPYGAVGQGPRVVLLATLGAEFAGL